MESQSQTFMDSEACINQMNASVQDGDPGVASSTPDRSEPQQPVKKPTRQWAAWTRQEEESFFTALRQVGKNFEKITRRVQSKNKDQVRHYYYRLVRRMNKLLGPGLCLDAKNSKDTNAAMLRWWSLLEKYSCKASKLHLKPRRFKIFIEALENQLMKDRKKNVRKRPSLGESSSPIAPSSVTNHNKASANDARTVKLVLVDSQNMQKLGTGRGSTKRNVNIGVIRSNKGDSTLIKPTRQRRKQVGVASSAAYKRWEKAAIAGVSLVADAAEHLERTATDREGEQDHGVPGFNFTDQVQRVMLPLPASLERNYNDSSAQTNLKLKLQLFPIDDATRRALEMDKHNPHLELTLSSRKKISSVMEHLNKKWGNSSVSAGELMLFPYSAHRENLVGYQGWTQESMASAADVHSAIGSPPVFRLRYGWFSSNEFMPIKWQDNLGSNQTSGRETTDFRIGKEMVVDLASTCGISTGDPSLNHMSPSRNRVTAVNKDDIPANPALEISSDINVPGARNDFIEPSANVQWHNKSNTDVCNKKQLDEVDGLRSSNGAAISAGEWADSLTNISVGDLLSEVPSVVNNDCIEPPPAQNDLYLQQTPFSCDSFDAAIAAHLSKHQKMVLPSAEAPHIYSIWDAEETCDAFSFQKICASCPEVTSLSTAASPVAGKQMPETGSMVTDAFLEESPDMDPVDCPTDGDPVDECPPDSPSIDAVTKDFSGLTDIYWPDSLGPLDLDIPSSKYHGNDLILSDSLSGLNRLIASSLDAFQNCSFFGGEKKDSSSAVEARESISFSDFKIGSGV